AEDLAEERPVAALALEPPGEPPSARPLEEGEVLGDLLVVDDGDVVLSGDGLDGEGEGAVQGTEFLGLAEDRPESLRAVEATPERMGGAEPVFAPEEGFLDSVEELPLHLVQLLHLVGRVFREGGRSENQ